MFRLTLLPLILKSAPILLSLLMTPLPGAQCGSSLCRGDFYAPDSVVKKAALLNAGQWLPVVC